jgi:hypothetical protein
MGTPIGLKKPFLSFIQLSKKNINPSPISFPSWSPLSLPLTQIYDQTPLKSFTSATLLITGFAPN